MGDEHPRRSGVAFALLTSGGRGQPEYMYVYILACVLVRVRVLAASTVGVCFAGRALCFFRVRCVGLQTSLTRVRATPAAAVSDP